jgi:hypothetical protein
MKTMETLLKTIKAQVDDPTKDASTLSTLTNLQVSTVLAKNALPDQIGELTGEARAKAGAEFKTRMIALLRAELTLEEAVLRGDRAAAHEALAELEQQRKDGHDAYNVDDHH